MTRTRVIIVGVLLAASLALSGCKKRRPPVPPPQAQAPTINVPTAQPETQPQPATGQPSAQPTEPEQPQPEANKPTPAIPRRKKPHIAKKAKPKKSEPSRIIVEDGGKDANTPPPPLIADTSADTAARQRKTEELLGAAEHNIGAIHRTLSPDEQAMVRHIRSYADQSREAIKEGDVDRAYNLAIKANLLSQSLKP